MRRCVNFVTACCETQFSVLNRKQDWTETSLLNCENGSIDKTLPDCRNGWTEGMLPDCKKTKKKRRRRAPSARRARAVNNRLRSLAVVFETIREMR